MLFRLTLILFLIVIAPYYKRIPRKVSGIVALASVGICIILTLVMRGNENLEFFSLHSKPICSSCGTGFVDDVCDKCQSKIEETGYFREVDSLKHIPFKEKFESFSSYKHEFTLLKILAVIFSVFIIFSLYNIIIYFLQGRKPKIEKHGLKSEKSAEQIMKQDRKMHIKDMQKS